MCLTLKDLVTADWDFAYSILRDTHPPLISERVERLIANYRQEVFPEEAQILRKPGNEYANGSYCVGRWVASRLARANEKQIEQLHNSAQQITATPGLGCEETEYRGSDS